MKRLRKEAHESAEAALWPLVVDVYAPYADYQRKTSRDIPVIVLSRDGASTEEGGHG